MLIVSLLGDFRIRLDEAPVAGVDTPRLQSLLAYLLLHRDSPQSRAHLAFTFWPDTSEAQARTNLRYLLHLLRRALPEPDTYLEPNMQTLQWRPEAALGLDVADFEAALARAEQASQASDSLQPQEALEQAVALYRGDLLPSCYDDWIIPHREALRQAYLGALERLIGLLEGRRDYEAAIHQAQRLLRHDPLQEGTYRRLIGLYALNGDRASALRVYHTCATVLQRELDVEPSAATREAYEQILGAGSRAAPAAAATTASSPLVGREKEWAQLQRAWRSAATGGGPHAVLLCGEAGIGKTRLAEDLLQWAARQGIAVASARCYAAEGQLAYAPVTAWLRSRPLASLESVWLAEVARLLPEMLAERPDLPRPAALTEAWQRQHLFEALSRAVLGTGQPLLLTIDDLQWCDQDTLEFVHFLLRFDRTARLLVAGTYRPEEIGGSHPLVATLQALRLAEQVTEIDLPPLDAAATRALATQVAGREIDGQTAEMLYHETEGNPLFVVETVRAGLPLYARQPDASTARMLPHDSLPGVFGLPPKVQSVLEARLAQVSALARDLMGLAATIGREFGFTLLAEASGRDEDTLVRDLDELWQRRIVRERGADAYDFSHDKLREVAYGGMSAARRRLLHRQVAEALEAIHALNLDPVSHQLAAHYERAGLPERALPYYLRAAEVARRLYANEEGIALLRRGLALVDEEATASRMRSDGLAAQLWEGLGDVLELMARHEEALQAYQNGQAHVLRGDPIGQARLHRKAGVTMREQRKYAEALDACHRAELALGSPPAEDAGEWWAEWVEVQVGKVWAHYWLAQWPEMAEVVKKVQPVVQQWGRVASRARFLMASCLLYLRRDRYAVTDEMLDTVQAALSASREWGELTTITESQFELGFMHLWRRELDVAEADLQAALKLAEACGAAWMRALTLTYLTVVHRFRGQTDEVRSHALRAEGAAVAANMPDYVAAAEGNLAWVAWREGNLAEAEARGLTARELWQGSALVYPFRWMGLGPLLAVALVQDRENDALAYAEALLDLTQQRLPDVLNDALERALHARAGEARGHLDHAVQVAQELGYL